MDNPLAKYLKQRGISQSRFAESHGWRQATISGWCNDVIPSIAHALKIERATDGAVLVSDWGEYAKSISKTSGEVA